MVHNEIPELTNQQWTKSGRNMRNSSVCSNRQLTNSLVLEQKCRSVVCQKHFRSPIVLNTNRSLLDPRKAFLQIRLILISKVVHISLLKCKQLFVMGNRNKNSPLDIFRLFVNHRRIHRSRSTLLLLGFNFKMYLNTWTSLLIRIIFLNLFIICSIKIGSIFHISAINSFIGLFIGFIRTTSITYTASDKD